MADEAANQGEDEAKAASAGGGGDDTDCPPTKCPDCPPGLPGWMATFSDLVTLLLTFFVLLLSFAKTETAKYEAALGSVRDAFGGNVLKQGETLMPGKSPDDSPEMLDAQDPVRPFPIEFLTTEGLLDKYEINRESDVNLKNLKKEIKEFDLEENVDIQEMPESIKMKIKDKVYFKLNSLDVTKSSGEVMSKLFSFLQKGNWKVFVEAHSHSTESYQGSSGYALSALRAQVITNILIKRGVQPSNITSVFYGDSRAHGGDAEYSPSEAARVEFVIQKSDLGGRGHSVPSQ